VCVAKIKFDYFLRGLQRSGKLRKRDFRVFGGKISEILEFQNVVTKPLSWKPIRVIGIEFGYGIWADVSCEIGIP